MYEENETIYFVTVLFLRRKKTTQSCVLNRRVIGMCNGKERLQVTELWRVACFPGDKYEPATKTTVMVPVRHEVGEHFPY